MNCIACMEKLQIEFNMELRKHIRNAKPNGKKVLFRMVELELISNSFCKVRNKVMRGVITE